MKGRKNMKSIKDIDREIKRINRQISQAAKTFGKESRLYEQYEAVLFPRSGTGLGGALLTRENKAGVIQISRSKSSLLQIQAISQYQTQLNNIGRMQTVQETKKKMIEAYERRTGIEVKGKQMKDEVVKSEVLAYQNMQALFAKHLQELYSIEKETGVELEVHAKIKEITKGRWTSEDNLKRMNNLALEATKGGNRKITGNKLKGW